MLSFAKNEPITAGMPWDMIQASQGRLGEDSLKEWVQKKEEIVKGFGELKTFLTKPAGSGTV